MKRVAKSLIISTLVLANFAASVAEAGISNVEISGRNVTFSIDSEQTESVRVVVSDVAHTSVIALRDEPIYKDGKFEIVVTIPEAVDSEEYEILVKTDESEIVSENFVYASSSAMQRLFDKLKNLKIETDDNIISAKEFFKSTSEEIIPLRVLCSQISEFEKLSDENQMTFLKLLNGDKNTWKDIEDAGKSIRYSLGMTMLNSGNKAGMDIISDDDLSDEERSWIRDCMGKKTSYKSFDEIDSAYAEARVLYSLNNAQIGEMYDLIVDAADILDVEESTSYSDYKSMSKYNQSKVNEIIIKSMDKTSFDTVEKFKEEFTSAVQAVSSSDKNNSGGGGSGGGSNSGGGSRTSGTNYTMHDIDKSTQTQAKDDIDKILFTDLHNASWAENMIYRLVEKNIVSGTEEGKFEPQRQVTREEFVTMIIRAKGLALKTGKLPFEDVNENSWFDTYVYTAVENGIVYGLTDDTFGVGKPITRQDMAVMIARAGSDSLFKKREYSEFADSDKISGYAKDSIVKLYCAGIIDGTDDNMFKPLNNLTRAEAAKVIYCTFAEEK